MATWKITWVNSFAEWSWAKETWKRERWSCKFIENVDYWEGKLCKEAGGSGKLKVDVRWGIIWEIDILN